jgi:hypothetical protein
MIYLSKLGWIYDGRVFGKHQINGRIGLFGGGSEG